MLLIAGANQVSIDWVQDLRSDTLLSIPQYLPQLAFPIGGVVIALQGLAHLLVPPVPKTDVSDATARDDVDANRR